MTIIVVTVFFPFPMFPAVLFPFAGWFLRRAARQTYFLYATMADTGHRTVTVTPCKVVPHLGQTA